MKDSAFGNVFARHILAVMLAMGFVAFGQAQNADEARAILESR
jgi:hypothetical protein